MDMSPQFSWLSELDMNDLLSLLDDLPDMNSLDEFLPHEGGGVTSMEDNNDLNLQAAVNHHHNNHPSFSSSVESTSNSTTAANQSPSTTRNVCLPPMILNFGSASMSPSKDDLEYVSPPLKRDRAQEEVLFADVAILNNNKSTSILNKKSNQKLAANQKSSTINKSTSHTRDHIMAERRRREKINERFIALSALLPGLKRTDKASVLGEAIKYVKQLQERINVLEEEEENSRKIGFESYRIGKKSRTLKSEEDNNNNGGLGHKQKHSPEIEARLSDKKSLLLKIQCKRRHSVLVQILCAIEKLGCSVTSVHAASFGDETLDITIIAQMEKEMDMVKPEHIVKDLSLVFTSV